MVRLTKKVPAAATRRDRGWLRVRLAKFSSRAGEPGWERGSSDHELLLCCVESATLVVIPEPSIHAVRRYAGGP